MTEFGVKRGGRLNQPWTHGFAGLVHFAAQLFVSHHVT